MASTSTPEQQVMDDSVRRRASQDPEDPKEQRLSQDPEDPKEQRLSQDSESKPAKEINCVFFKILPWPNEKGEEDVKPETPKYLQSLLCDLNCWKCWFMCFLPSTECLKKCPCIACCLPLVACFKCLVAKCCPPPCCIPFIACYKCFMAKCCPPPCCKCCPPPCCKPSCSCCQCCTCFTCWCKSCFCKPPKITCSPPKFSPPLFWCRPTCCDACCTSCTCVVPSTNCGCGFAMPCFFKPIAICCSIFPCCWLMDEEENAFWKYKSRDGLLGFVISSLMIPVRLLKTLVMLLTWPLRKLWSIIGPPIKKICGIIMVPFKKCCKIIMVPFKIIAVPFKKCFNAIAKVIVPPLKIILTPLRILLTPVIAPVKFVFRKPARMVKSFFYPSAKRKEVDVEEGLLSPEEKQEAQASSSSSTTEAPKEQMMEQARQATEQAPDAPEGQTVSKSLAGS